MRKGSFIFTKVIFISIGMIFFSACESKQTEGSDSNISQNQPSNLVTNTNSVSESTSQTEKKETHEHTAPHNGTLIAFGEEFAHLEIVVDAEKGEITAYVLDGEAEKSVQIAQEKIEIEIEKPNKVNLKLEAAENTLTGEKSGATSEFRTNNDRLKNLKEFEAKINSITVRGKEFKNVHFNFPKGTEEKHQH